MTMTRRLLAGAVTVALLGVTVAAQKISITGAGATFPAPIYEKWFSEYNKLHPDVQINYQPVGSGGGVSQITQQTVFFGASDQPMTDDALSKTPGHVFHFPTVLGAVVPVYNIPGVMTDLKFTGPLIADIFLGKITRWNDKAIAAVNPGVTLPAADIAVVHRSDGSGTSFIWTDYLSKVSPEWKQKVGANGSVSWPTGLAGNHNDGVAALVKQTPGAFGYVELIYALQNNIAFGVVQNAAGKFVKASLDSVTAAAAGAAASMPADFRVSITNAPGAATYPISSFTWLLLYENPKDKALAKTMNDFVKWALSDGQKLCAGLGYAPLPPNVVKLELAQLAKIALQ
jgi:phosphate transport system substrate-binding protein